MAIERIQQRRGTTAEWATSNPILAFGEIGIEVTTTGVIRLKVGDDESTWSELPYFDNVQGLNLGQYVTEAEAAAILANYIPASQKGSANGVATLDSAGNVPMDQLDNLINGAPNTLDTLKEISDLLGNTGDLTGTLISEIASKAELDHDHDMEDLLGFDTTGSIAGQTLIYNGQTQKWENENFPSVALNDISDVAITSAAPGNILTYTLGGWVNQAPASVDLSSYATKDGVETLTNKTLTAPNINSPAVNEAKLKTPVESGTYLITALGASTTIDIATSGTVYFADGNLASDAAINLRWSGAATLGSKLGQGDSFVFTAIVKNLNTSWRISSLSIDGTAITPRWLNNVAPTAGTPNSTEVYSYIITRTASSWVVLASRSIFGV